jgi:hypothetical protein
MSVPLMMLLLQLQMQAQVLKKLLAIKLLLMRVVAIKQKMVMQRQID